MILPGRPQRLLALQTKQVAELLSIIQQQSKHLEQYRAALDAQRVSNSSLNADCQKIQSRQDRPALLEC